MALTIDEEAEVKAVAAERIKARAVAALTVTRDAETKTAQTTYEAGVKAARDKFTAAVAALATIVEK